MAKIKLLSTSMAAAKLGFTPDYVRKLCGDGTIKAMKVGWDWLIDERDLKSIKRQRKAKEIVDVSSERST